MAGSAIRASHLVGDARVQDPYCLRCQPQVMGACLDLLRMSAATLAAEANGVSDNPLVFSEEGEVISGGNFHAEPVAFAADQIAMALCEIGSLAERRIAMLVDPALSGMPAFLTPRPGLNSGFMIPQVTAAALVAENRQRAFPASVDTIPTSANQEDHVSMATHGARRLAAMAANAASIVGIELLCAAQGCDFHAPLASSASLEAVRALVRASRAASGRRPASRAGHRGRNGARPCRPACRNRRAGPPAFDHGRERMSWLTVREGQAPLLVSLPHTGTDIPEEVAEKLVSLPLARTDTDWWVDRLYDFAAELDATIVRTSISRTVIDVNRDPSGATLYPGQATTGLCPLTTFAGEPLYKPGMEPDEEEVSERRKAYFEPYHTRSQDRDRPIAHASPGRRALRLPLDPVRSSRGSSRVSFPSSTSAPTGGRVAIRRCRRWSRAACAHSGFPTVSNGRFTGGWITRSLGDPAGGVHAVQMELACRAYMDESPEPEPAPYSAARAARRSAGAEAASRRSSRLGQPPAMTDQDSYPA